MQTGSLSDHLYGDALDSICCPLDANKTPDQTPSMSPCLVIDSGSTPGPRELPCVSDSAKHL